MKVISKTCVMCTGIGIMCLYSKILRMENVFHTIGKQEVAEHRSENCLHSTNQHYQAADHI